MDRVLRHAIAEGLPPMTAIQMATLNTAEHFGLSRELGQIAPRRWADILLVDDLRNFYAEVVIARGLVVAENGKLLVELPEVEHPEWATRSVHLKRRLETGDFRILVPKETSNEKRVTCNVIGIIENQAPTKHLRLNLPVMEGELVTHNSSLVPGGVAKIALVERHHGSGRMQVGLVSGFGFSERCAIASTVAHDCHHMVVIGTDEMDMALAANKLAEVGGGQVVVKDGQIVGLVELAIGGLMSAERAEVVAEKANTILEGFRLCGCNLNNPNMQLSLLALVVIPELRLSDKGLVDVNHFTFLPVVEGPAK
jgi:adenine deaminase